MGGPTWSVAIFTSREDATVLQRTIEAVVAACSSTTHPSTTHSSIMHPSIIDVLVDGNEPTATALAAWRPPSTDATTTRLWLVPWRDKACTWNRYLHEIAPDAATAFFVDGYVRPAANSFTALDAALARDPHAWAATGVPTVGPSAARQRRALLADGGLHGNLYALRGSTVALLKARGFRLPLGLYRNDSLIGAVMAFGADPAREAWDPTRIAVIDDATWDNDVLPTLGIARVRSYLKRRLRQAQGTLENNAVREHLAIRKQSPESLPSTVQALIDAGPPDAIARRGLVERPWLRFAARRLAQPTDWSRCDEPARLLQTWGAV